MRDVCLSLINDRGLVILEWVRYIEGDKVRWKEGKKVGVVLWCFCMYIVCLCLHVHAYVGVCDLGKWIVDSVSSYLVIMNSEPWFPSNIFIYMYMLNMTYVHWTKCFVKSVFFFCFVFSASLLQQIFRKYNSLGLQKSSSHGRPLTELPVQQEVSFNSW